MTVLDLEKDNKLGETDIHVISDAIVSIIDVKSSTKKKKTISAKEAILDSLADMLEKMLLLETNISKQKKVELIHLLNKLKANKEYMQLLKKNIAHDQRLFLDLKAASEHMFKKSQSAFSID